MSPLLGIGEFLLQPTHLLFILLIGILIFGKRLPEIGRSLGTGLRGFKESINGEEREQRVDQATIGSAPEPQATTERSMDHPQVRPVA